MAKKRAYIVLMTENGYADRFYEFPTLSMASDFLYEAEKHYKNNSYMLFEKGSISFAIDQDEEDGLH